MDKIIIDSRKNEILIINIAMVIIGLLLIFQSSAKCNSNFKTGHETTEKSSAQQVNTLTETYSQAFYNPHGFDSYLNDQVVLNPDFYTEFENCVSLAISLIVEMENQTRQNYANCRNNAHCTQLAKDIQSLESLQVNVNNLAQFIGVTKFNSQARFIDSVIGQAALIVYNFHRDIGLDLRNNPEFIKQIRILANTPCL